MFRKMRRFKQELSQEECIEILKNEPRGVLSMFGEDGYPYGIPMSHYYNEETGKIYFHCAKEGHKLDAIRACDKVSFCVMDKGFRKEGDWALNIKSVVVFGRICELTDDEKKKDFLVRLCGKFSDDPEYSERELRTSFSRVCCLELTIDHMTGKLVNES
ncbi:MAG: pyridoxamine 5'-phosphate oxidase family protein [Clostridiales bacterium]|nr:pyridoxamine 5'-phosphate oxidase family protein [Clostridiales bacterium]